MRRLGGLLETTVLMYQVEKGTHDGLDILIGKALLVDNWLKWSGMKAKVPKCHSMALQGLSGRPVDPKLHLAGDAIPYAASEPAKFFGIQIHVSHDTYLQHKESPCHPLAADAGESRCLPCDKTPEVASLQGWHLPTTVMATHN